MNWNRLQTVCRIAIQIVLVTTLLSVTFLQLMKYIEENTNISTSYEEDKGDLELPSMTFCPQYQYQYQDMKQEMDEIECLIVATEKELDNLVKFLSETFHHQYHLGGNVSTKKERVKQYEQLKQRIANVHNKTVCKAYPKPTLGPAWAYPRPTLDLAWACPRPILDQA